MSPVFHPRPPAPPPPPPARRVPPAPPPRPMGRAPVPSRAALPPPARPQPAPAVEVPDRAEAAAKALGQGKVVVFFFTRPGTPDDSATAAAVRSLHGMKNVAVFKA